MKVASVIGCLTSSVSKPIPSVSSCVITPTLYQDIVSIHMTNNFLPLKSNVSFFGRISVRVLAEEKGGRIFKKRSLRWTKPDSG